MTLEGHTLIGLSLSDTGTQEFKNEQIMLDGGGLPWPLVLSSMVGFLSEFYGYDLFDEVGLRRKPGRDTGGWSGQFFGKATDEEIRLYKMLEEASEGGPEGDEE